MIVLKCNDGDGGHWKLQQFHCYTKCQSFGLNNNNNNINNMCLNYSIVNKWQTTIVV